MLKVVIFDLDDTLYRESDYVKSGFRHIAKVASKKFGVKEGEFYKKELGFFSTMGRGKVFDECLKTYGVYSKEHVLEFVSLYRNHTPKIKLYSSVEKELQKLKRNYKICLITDGLIQTQKKKISALKLKSVFDCIVFTNNEKDRIKPNTWAFHKILKKFNVKSCECVYIGDDPYKDFVGANKLGIITIRVNQGRFKGVQIDNSKLSRYTANNISSVFKIIKNR